MKIGRVPTMITNRVVRAQVLPIDAIRIVALTKQVRKIYSTSLRNSRVVSKRILNHKL